MGDGKQRRSVRVESVVADMDSSIVEPLVESSGLRYINDGPEWFVRECEEDARKMTYQHGSEVTFAVVNDVAWFFLGDEERVLDMLHAAAVMAC